MWISDSRAIPKSVKVSAKTADAPSSPLRGLVVNPYENVDAFTDRSLTRAEDNWDKFAEHGLPSGFSIETTGRFSGALKQGTKMIHSDFDLLAIISSDEKSTKRYHSVGRWIGESERKEDWQYVEDSDFYKLYHYVKAGVRYTTKVDMIQHGPDMAWKDSDSSKFGELIWGFGPNGEETISTNAMGHEAAIQ